MNPVADAASFVASLPYILVYLLPGYIGVSFFFEVMRRTIDSSEKIILSCVLSYMVVSGIRLADQALNIYLEFLIATAICFGLSWLLVEILQRKWLRKFLIDRMNYSPAKGAWEDSVDYDLGTWIRVRLKSDGRVIIGTLHSLGNVESDPWLSIGDYSEYDDECAAEPSRVVHGEGKYFLIHLNDIDYCETSTPDKA